MNTPAFPAALRPVRTPALLALATAFLSLLPSLPAQATSENAGGLALQQGRAGRMALLKEKVYYTGKRFDLDALPSYKPEQKIAATIKIWGLNYLGDCMLAEYWDKGFRHYHPDAKIEYRLPVAMLATSGLCTGTCDIGANRRATFTEYLQFERIFNYDMFEVPLASGGLDSGSWSEAMCIFVHQDNPIAGLSMKQLDGIFGAERDGGWVLTSWHPEYPFARGPEENIRTWGQAGLTGEWANQRIHPYAPCIRYDTATKFSDAVLYSSDKWNEETHMYGNFPKPGGGSDAWFMGIRRALLKDRYGIGVMGHQNAGPGIRTVGVQGRPNGPYVQPTWDTVQTREYPLIQANYFYINRKPGQPIEPKVKEFLRYTLSREGQEEVARDGKYTPLNAELVAAALKSLE